MREKHLAALQQQKKRARAQACVRAGSGQLLSDRTAAAGRKPDRDSHSTEAVAP
jgi:hypothetical protein